MDQFVGLDVSQEKTHLCVIDGDGKIVWREKCLSTPEDIAGTIRSKAPDVMRIGFESGPLSTWHWHALKAMGLPVVCLDSRHAQATMSGQVNKTDKNDAYGLAQVIRAGWYREVGVKSLDSHAVRSMLAPLRPSLSFRYTQVGVPLGSANVIDREAAIDCGGATRRSHDKKSRSLGATGCGMFWP
jgi:transposase